MFRKIEFLIFGTLLLGVVSCGNDESVPGEGDSFDREAMLAHWADNIIIPSYEMYIDRLGSMEDAAESFEGDPTVANLSALRFAWLEAYGNWQLVSMFEIGMAEELSLRNFTNVFPVNVDDMIASLEAGDFDLSMVNSQDEQGFPAIDYLINGLRGTDEEIVEVYLDETIGQSYKTYLLFCVKRVSALGFSVLEDWRNGYRDTFVNNSGSDATSSVNKLVNDLIFYYEKHLRAGKIGIPAGVFSAAPLPDRVEALYFEGASKVLFETALDAFEGFFNGKSVGSSIGGESLRSYLDFLRATSEGEDISGSINAQFSVIRAEMEELNDDFEVQINADNSKMLTTYDELQKNVVLLKVDMMQALNIRVDFVDADGD